MNSSGRNFNHAGFFSYNKRRNHIENHHHIQRSSSPTRHSTVSMFKPTDNLDYQFFCMGLLSTKVIHSVRGTPKQSSLIGGNIVMAKNSTPVEDPWKKFADRMNKCIREKQKNAKHVFNENRNQLSRCSSPFPNYSGTVFRKRGDAEYRDFCNGILSNR